MQVSFSPINIYNTSFKGSFKISDLDALIADFEIDEKDVKPVVEEVKPQPKVKAIAKKFNILSNSEITKVRMWGSSQSAINSHIPTDVKIVSKQQHIHPTDDLFVIQGLTDDNKRYVLFNTFFKNEDDGADCTQVYYLESEDENYTQLQKNVFKLFREPRNKRYLISNSTCNPFAKFSHGAPGSTDFAPVINAMAEVSREANPNDMVDENGEYRPIIYTADGEYIRYKHYTAPFRK